MRITLGDIRNSSIPSAVGVCANDSRLTRWVNDAQERLVHSGKWWGTYGKFRICASNGCITLPNRIATVESAAMCGAPLTVRDQWFEFLQAGAGLRDFGCNIGCGLWGEALMQGRFPTFSDIIGTDKKLKFVCDVAADVGTQIIVTGYDANGNWIRTQQSGIWANGEIVTLAQGAGTVTTNYFTRVVDILFPAVMNGQSWCYEHSTTPSDRLIGQYEYNDIRPSFARYLFPSLRQATQDAALCPCQQNGQVQPQLTAQCDYTTQTRIDIMGKLEVIKVVNDNDYLILGCMPALQEMIVGIVNAIKEPDSLRKNAIVTAAQKVAERLLDEELNHYRGDGVEVGVQVTGSSVGYVCPVISFI